ncbi:hypothetical protein FVEN_g4388 [Fusarium venenatum]|uniref:Uncharacterized protein n=1 Tax=Fusarium venenatum TaxID=56646 RepID=A0A2L2TRF4_9HYPO|nr:uncharacterized protein FVRRES_02728 [Fusarium venenatum]KAG8357886.1 hypothetical protein FVEN_g4388 [Fusarium venenatum]KAH7004190.1 hypothetical protein EDB82DRAFT_550547 [Fusarium venenatum]CEI66216.1 unnamed protein product [Fusarium venenatum]
MRFEFTSLVAFLATTALADRMEIFTKCGDTSCNSYDGWFYTDYGAYRVNANTGCRVPGVPHMEEFCIDWDNRRLHFRFGGQDKRCMTQDSESAYGCGATCYKTTWREIPCYWRMAPIPEEQLATEVQSSAPSTTAEVKGKRAVNF